MITTETTRTTAPQPAETARHHATRQIIGIDFIRFFAALLVLAFHLGYWDFTIEPQAGTVLPLPSGWFGWIGVHIFFVISGFVIAYSAQKATALSFVKSRILRLYPAAWICATLTFAFFRFNRGLFHPWLRSIALSPVGPWIDGSYWTLGIELSFYFLVFCLLCFNRFRLLGPVMTLIATADVACFLISHSANHGANASQAFASFFYAHPWPDLLLLHHGSLFALGTLIWLCLFDRVTPVLVLGLIVSTIGSLLMIHLHFSEIAQQAHTNFSFAVPCTVWCLSVLAILLSVRFNTTLEHVLGHRGSRISRLLGLITYPLYLLHQHIGFRLIPHLEKFLPPLAALVVDALVTALLSYLVIRFLEKPIREALRHTLHLTRKALQAPAASLP